MNLAYAMFFRVLIFILVIQNSLVGICQIQEQYWHFGSTNRGLFFDAGSSYSVSVTTNSYTPYSNEGCSVVCDLSSGDLLFYTDGVRVVDAEHNVMPNGSGLSGNSSSFSNGAVCQNPANCDQYFVFSMNYVTEIGTVGSLYYTLVDMSLPGNGTLLEPRGDVVPGQKNILITTSVSEGLEIVPKAESHEFWLIVNKNNSNEMEIYDISSAGISYSSDYLIPVIMEDVRCIDYCEQNGKICVFSMIEQDPCLILDFNNITGQFTTCNIIPGTPWGSSTNYWQGTLDGEWSPDGSKLYISKYRWGSISGGRLYQYDLNTPMTPPMLIHSMSSSNSAISKGLKLAPNGKIYLLYTNASGATNQLHVVNLPNEPGLSCNFEADGLNMGMNLGLTGVFPRFIYQNNTIPEIPDTTISFLCDLLPVYFFEPLLNISDNEGDSLSFAVNNHAGLDYTISGDGLDITFDSGFVGNPFIEIIYNDDFCFPLQDTFVVEFATTSGVGSTGLIDSITVCNEVTTVLDAGSGFVSYYWAGGQTTQTISVSSDGWYSVEKDNGSGCTFVDSILVNFSSSTPIDLGLDISMCADSIEVSLVFFGDLIWSNGTTGNETTVYANTILSVIAENVDGCFSYDTIGVVLYPKPFIDLGEDLNFCAGEIVELSASGFTSILWNTGETDSIIIVDTEGIYSVEVENEFNCIGMDEILVQFHNPIPINLGPDIEICASETMISVGFVGNQEWSTGETSSSIIVGQTGVYTVIGTDTNGCVSFDTIYVQLNPIPMVDLGSDTTVCANDFYLVVEGFNQLVWNNGSVSDSILVQNEGVYTIEVQNDFGCIGYDEVQINFVDVAPLDLGSDISSCSNNKIVLNSGITYGDLIWNTGETTPSIQVDQTGYYWVDYSICGSNFSDTVFVEYNSLDNVFYIPNCFTPDGNAVNNHFSVVFADYSQVIYYEITILNRWGEVVFTSQNFLESWDGTGLNGLIQDGVYIYRLDVEMNCGENKMETIYGHITVLK